MKKIYIKPTTNTYIVEVSSLLTASLNMSSTDASTSGGTYNNSLSRGFDDWDED